MNLNPGEFAELLRQVRVGGDEDGPSLRVADYLEECGDHDRAVLIRRMVDLPKFDGGRSTANISLELEVASSCFDALRLVFWKQFKNHIGSGDVWKTTRPGLGTTVFATSWHCERNRSRVTLDWKRGLVEAVSTNGPTWAELAETLTDNHPVRSVALSSLPVVTYHNDQKHRRVVFACGNRRVEFDRRDLDRDRNMPSTTHVVDLLWPEIKFTFQPPVSQSTFGRASLLDSIQSAFNMGVPLPTSHVRHALGLPSPADYGFYGDPTE